MTVFLLTDIEGSTAKWERYPALMAQALARHDAILKAEIEQSRGRVIKHTGDGVFAVFEDGDPLQCAIGIQRVLAGDDWSGIGGLRIRIGLNAGDAQRRGEDYFGPVINRTARIMSAAWGGQILLTAEALRACRLPADAEVRDLGRHLLKDLVEPQVVFQLIHPSLTDRDFPPLHSMADHPHNLPVQSTPFLGREEELAEIVRLLKDPTCRLLTLIGPGGIGKTRLAIQTAAEKIEDFQHGVYFIPLAPLTAPEFLVSGLAQALNYSFYPAADEKTQLIDYLREKEMLLILDNFEHLTGGAGIIAEILSHAPRIKILVTSRELLNLQGEWVLTIKGMSFPGSSAVSIEDYGAVQLFLANARRVKTNIEFGPDDKAYLVRICQLVSGLPLGIELAATWLRTLSCREICQEIEKNFDFVAAALRDLPERHRSLRAVFDYSWNLMSGPERATLTALSVFPGDFDRTAAENVAEAGLPILTALADKSLLRRNERGRYDLPGAVRQYAAEKLGDQPDRKRSTTERFCVYYAGFLEMREAAMDGPDQRTTLAGIAAEIENVRRAWNLMVEQGRIDDLKRCLGALYIFYRKQGWHREGAEVFEQAAARLIDADPGFYNRVRARYAVLASSHGRLAQTRQQLEECLAVDRTINNPVETAWVLNELGTAYRLIGDMPRAQAAYEEGLALYRTAGRPNNVADVLVNLGATVDAAGDYPTANRHLHEAITLFRTSGDNAGIAIALNRLGNIAETLGDFSEARRLYEESLAISRDLNNRMGEATALNNIGNIAAQTGDREAGRKSYEASLVIFTDLGHRRGIASALTNIGILLKYAGDPKEALKKFEETLAIFRDIGYPIGIAATLSQLGGVARVQGDIAQAKRYYEEAYSVATALGDKWTLANILANLGEITYLTGNYPESWLYYMMSLRTARDIKALPMILVTLRGVADHLVRERKFDLVIPVLTVIRDHPITEPEPRADSAAILDKLRQELGPDGFNGFDAGGKGWTVETILDRVLAS